MQANFYPEYTDGQSFSTMLATFYPCFTGILAGANRAETLADPFYSIPYGTIGAVITSAILYTSLFTLWAGVADRDYLKGDVCWVNTTSSRRLLAGGGSDCGVLEDIGWPSPVLLQWGVVVASIAQALQCMINAPNILQAIAADGAVPVLKPFRTVAYDGEAKMAMIPCYVVVALGVLMGKIELVAPIVSMCFLTCYATINVACFVSAVTHAPSWRHGLTQTPTRNLKF